MFKSLLTVGLLFSMSNLFAASVCIITSSVYSSEIVVSCDGSFGVWNDKGTLSSALKEKIEANYNIINVSTAGTNASKVQYTLIQK